MGGKTTCVLITIRKNLCVIKDQIVQSNYFVEGTSFSLNKFHPEFPSIFFTAQIFDVSLKKKIFQRLFHISKTYHSFFYQVIATES